MSKKLYMTSRNYIYDRKSCRMFRISSDLRSILSRYDDIDRLRIDEPQAYKVLEPILSDTNSPPAQTKSDPYALSTLQLVVSNECNLACSYCYAHNGTYERPMKQMNIDTAVCAIDTMFSLYKHIDSITFFGGEPLLCVDLIDKICKYLNVKYYGRFKRIGIMSNLYDLTDDAIRIIKKYNIQIATSLDGDEERNAYRVTKTKSNSFNQVATNISKLHKNTGQPVSIEVTMTNLHSEIGWDAVAVTDYLSKRFSINNYTVNSVMVFDKNMKEYEFEGENFSAKESVEKFIEAGIFDMKINQLISIITGKYCGEYLCNAGSGQLSIFPNGDIYPCHIYSMDTSNRFCMGNVNIFDEDIFNSVKKEVHKFNSKKFYKKCENCSAYNICSSCMGSKLVASTDNLPHEDDYCEKFCEYVDELIEIYAELLDKPSKMQIFKKRLKETDNLC